MRLPAAKRSPQREDNLVPLINIVFLLLIFFMLAGSLTTPELFEIEPLQSSSERVDEQQALVFLSDEGTLALENEILSAEQLATRLRARLQVQPELAVRIKADARVDSQRLIAVLDELRGTGLERVMLLTVARAP